MKHLTPYKIFESTELDLKEILLELKDMGYTITHDDAIRGPGYDENDNDRLKSIWIKDNINPSDWVELPWSELKEYALRIKDYLGDKFVSFQWRKIVEFSSPIPPFTSNPYKTVELNEETEIDDRVWSFVIKYKE